MSHPVCACLEAADLARVVWAIAAKEKLTINELRKNYEYREAMAEYVGHLGECTLCRTVLEDMNEEARQDIMDNQRESQLDRGT